MRRVVTPHCYDGVYDYYQDHDTIAHTDMFNAALQDEHIALTVLPGAEIRLTPEFLYCVRQGKVLTIGNGFGDVLLVQKILKREVRCDLASDGHCAKKRNPMLSKAIKRSSQLVGYAVADKMVTIELGNVQTPITNISFN